MKYLAELDGVRALAVYLVVAYHAGNSWADGGFIGVDLFFVLSGFLVTGVLLREHDRDGRVHLGGFYSRRIRRLLPAALVVIVVVSALWLLVESEAGRVPLVSDARATLLYYANWHFAAQASDYFGANVDSSPFLHFWSLAIEEQFYVVFPLLLVGLLRFERTRRWVVPAVLLAIAVLSVASQLWWAGRDPNRAYYATDTRVYQLLAGALLSLAVRQRARVKAARRGRRAEHLQPGGVTSSLAPAALCAVGGLALLLLVGSGAGGVSPTVSGFGATIGSLLLVGGLVGSPTAWLTRMFRGPAYLGRISYGTYLWHWPVNLLVGKIFSVSPLTTGVIVAVVGTGLAALSYQVLERPIRTAKLPSWAGWPTVAVGLAAGALLAFTVVPRVLESTSNPALVAQETGTGTVGIGGVPADERRAPVPDGFDYQAISQDDGPDDLSCTADDPDACVAVEGDGPRVLLVGDSHGRMLAGAFAKLAEQHDFELSTQTIGGCPWQQATWVPEQSQTLIDQCKDERSTFYTDVVPAIDPDVVVLVSLTRDLKPGDSTFTSSDVGSDEGPEQLLARKTDETLQLIEDAGARAVIVQGVMRTPGVDIPDCLSAATRLDQCEVPIPQTQPISDSIYVDRAVRDTDVDTIDINDLVCPGAPLCQPVVDGEVVWRNSTHITATYAEDVSAGIWKKLTKTPVWESLGTS